MSNVPKPALQTSNTDLTPASREREQDQGLPTEHPSAAAYEEYLDGFTIEFDEPQRQVKPPILTIASDKESLEKLIPNLPPLLHRLSEQCDELGLSKEHAAILLTPDEIGQTPFKTEGPVLVATLPKQLEGSLQKLVNCEPYIFNIQSLDLRDSYTVARWRARDIHGTPHNIFIQDSLLDALLTRHVTEKDWLWSGRLIFIAADKVVLSEFWLGEDEMQGYAVTRMCAPRYHQHSKEEQIQGKEAAEAAGSPTPWMFNTWRDEDGIDWSALCWHYTP